MFDIKENLKIDKKPEPEVLFFLPDIHQNAGGVHIVVDIVNYLNKGERKYENI